MKCAASMLLIALVLVAYTLLTAAKGPDRPRGRVHGGVLAARRRTAAAAPATGPTGTAVATPSNMAAGPTPVPEPAAAEFQATNYAPW